jgi:glyoxylase-like metal-dependent hydrolase (beta-lactamase superfamily II)
MTVTTDDRYEVLIVRFGSRSARAADVYLNHAMYGDPDATIEMAYYFWVIRNQHRTMLVDTGFSDSGGERRRRVRHLDRQAAFEAAGIDPAAGIPVIVTHAHYDHIGNLDLFRNSPVHIAGAEYDFWMSSLRDRAQFSRSVEEPELEELRRAEREGRLQRHAGRTVLAPGVELVEVGGHTPWQLIVLVETDAGRVILASDAVHFYDEYDLDRPYAFVADVAETYRAYDLIRELLDERSGHLVAGHDVACLERFTPIDSGPLAGEAARIG